LIAQHSQVELTIKPTVEPTIEPAIEPTVETTINIHRYMIRADRNQFDDILIDTRSKLITINLATMPINIQSKLIAITTITHIQGFIGYLAIYAG
jgi:hypothetical protein